MTHKDWLCCGYADAQEHTIYKRAPGPEPPELPLEYLSDDWQAYFEGIQAACNDTMATALRRPKNAHRA